MQQKQVIQMSSQQLRPNLMKTNLMKKKLLKLGIMKLIVTQMIMFNRITQSNQLAQLLIQLQANNQSRSNNQINSKQRQRSSGDIPIARNKQVVAQEHKVNNSHNLNINSNNNNQLLTLNLKSMIDNMLQLSSCLMKNSNNGIMTIKRGLKLIRQEWILNDQLSF